MPRLGIKLIQIIDEFLGAFDYRKCTMLLVIHV